MLKEQLKKDEIAAMKARDKARDLSLLWMLMKSCLQSFMVMINE